MQIAVLASGSGTLLDAILTDGIPVSLVVVDRPCAATGVAERHGVKAVVHERTSFGASFDRDAYSAEIAQLLRDAGIELVVMAGWGTIFGEAIFDEFPRRVLLTHPALLPAFRGWHAVEDALAYGVKLTGCTILIATVEMDVGPILAQEAVPVLPDDDTASLHERIKGVERRLYPQTIRRVLEDPSLLDEAVAPKETSR